MVKRVFLAVRAGFLNIVKASVGFKGLNSVLCFIVCDNLRVKALGGGVFILVFFSNPQSNYDIS
jgi:hypothetical protein